MFDRTKLQKALTLCLGDFVQTENKPETNFFWYLEQANCHIDDPRMLRILFEQHSKDIIGYLDQACQRLSFGQLGMVLVKPRPPLSQYSPILVAEVVARQGRIPENVRPMAIAFLENGLIKTVGTPTRDRFELWEFVSE